MTKAITNMDDVIDSRDVIERIEELAAFVADGASDATDIERGAATEELAKLRALAQAGESVAADWQYGECLIRESYFKEYAQQFADDIGALDASASWPNNCIDWDRAARELRMDYSAIDFGGITYLIR